MNRRSSRSTSRTTNFHPCIIIPKRTNRTCLNCAPNNCWCYSKHERRRYTQADGRVLLKGSGVNRWRRTILGIDLSYIRGEKSGASGRHQYVTHTTRQPCFPHPLWSRFIGRMKRTSPAVATVLLFVVSTLRNSILLAIQHPNKGLFITKRIQQHQSKRKCASNRYNG